MTYSIIISNNSSLFSKSCDKQPCNDEWIVVIIRENALLFFSINDVTDRYSCFIARAER
jgi:hypothetical protein